MDKMIKKIYDLVYSPIVTPYNLLENAKLKNYSYVKYFKGEAGLIAEMKCTMEGCQDAIFYYHFDKEDKLNCVYMEDNSGKNLVYDRQEEIEKIKRDIKSKNRVVSA